jgi:hypothetical protein
LLNKGKIIIEIDRVLSLWVRGILQDTRSSRRWQRLRSDGVPFLPIFDQENTISNALFIKICGFPALLRRCFEQKRAVTALRECATQSKITICKSDYLKNSTEESTVLSKAKEK